MLIQITHATGAAMLIHASAIPDMLLRDLKLGCGCGSCELCHYIMTGPLPWLVCTNSLCLARYVYQVYPTRALAKMPIQLLM